MVEQGDLTARTQEVNALSADFIAFFRTRISGLLPRECKAGKENCDVIRCPEILHVRYNINYVLRNGEAEGPKKPNIPDRKIVEQSLRLYALSKGDLLKRLHVVIESENYFFEYV
jgi:hypothetical protein